MTAPRGFAAGFCWVFGEEAPETGLKRLRECGFEGIELWPDALDRWGAARWRAALAAEGLACFQLCPYFNFMKGEASMEASRRIFDRFLAAAKELDCRRLRAFTGPPWGEGVVGAREATARQWDDSIAGLREFCDGAAPDGVEICLECHEGSLMEDAPAALRLLRGVDRPNLTTNLQLPLLNEPWTESLALLAETTSHVHIHNWTEGLGEGTMTFLEAGAFDWEPVVRTLLEKGRDGLVLSVEHANHGGHDDPWETAHRDGPYLRRLREKVAGT